MEMNTRIQVEHPVTEAVTGVDLIKEQIRVAAGEPLPCRRTRSSCGATRSSAASTPRTPTATSRQPAAASRTSTRRAGPGRAWTPTARGLDGAPFYDSLIAKLIVWGKDREEAMDRTLRALAEFDIQGAGRPTIGFHQRVLSHPVFRSGDYYLDFLEKYMNADGTLTSRPRSRPPGAG